MNSPLRNFDPDENLFNAREDSISRDRQSLFYSVCNYNRTFTSSKFAILNFNIRSFNANSDEFVGFVDSLIRLPDVMVLTETWANDSNVDQIQIAGYESFHTMRKGGGRGGGVSVLIKNCYLCKHHVSLSYSNRNLESCVVSVEFGGEKLFIVGIYRPHGGTTENFTSDLSETLDSETLRNKYICVLGDFNVDLLDQRTESSINFVLAMQSFSFIPTITKPTRFSNSEVQRGASLLDHIWINRLTDHCSGILISGITDHLPTFLVFPRIAEGPKLRKISFRTHDLEHVQIFRQSLFVFDWRLAQYNCAHERVSYFIETINLLYRQHFPMKVKFLSEKRISKPWLTPGILQSIKTKSYYFKMFRLGQIDSNFLKKYNNKLTSLIRMSKRRYYLSAFAKCKSDLRSTWKLVGNIMSRGTKFSGIGSVVSDEVELTNDFEIAEAFNYYFSNVAHDLDRNIPQSDTLPTEYINLDMPNSFFIAPYFCETFNVQTINQIFLYQCDEFIKKLINL